MADVPPAPNRCTLSDDGVTIRIAIYAHALSEPVAVAELSSVHAVRLCAELAAAAAAHLARERNGRIGVIRGPA